MNIGRVVEIAVFAVLVLFLGVFVLADRRALGRQIVEVRSQAEANEKALDEARNDMRFLVLRVEDLEKDVVVLAQYAENHTHPGSMQKPRPVPNQKRPSLLLKLRDKLRK